MSLIQVNNITGSTPILVYIADINGNNQTYIDTISSPVPPPVLIVTIPSLFSSASQVMVVMVDANSCQTFQILDCGPVPSPSVTPTVTPTITVTPSVTPTITVTPSVTPTITVTSSITPSVTPTITTTPSVTPTITTTPSVTPTTTITPSVTPTITLTNTPTNTIGLTPSATPTITVTPSITPTITVTPSTSGTAYYAYIFAEPQDLTDDTTLYNYAVANGAIDWYSWYSAGLPSNNGGNYSNDLNVYAHQPSFVIGGGDFVTPLNLKGPIAQSSTTYLGCPQSQYTFGTISVSTSQVNTSLQYFYSIWIPLAGVGGTFNQMYFDLGTSLCGSEIYNDLPADSVLNQINVTVTSGAAIPAGVYRVMWASPNLLRPTSPPLNVTYYFRGESKT